MRNKTAFHYILFWLSPMIGGLVIFPLVRQSDNGRFLTAAVCIVVTFLGMSLNYLFRAREMWRHVEISNEGIWRELNTIPLLGHGFRNIPKFASFMFVAKGNEDSILVDLKMKTKESLWYLIAAFVSLPFFFLIYMSL